MTKQRRSVPFRRLSNHVPDSPPSSKPMPLAKQLDQAGKMLEEMDKDELGKSAALLMRAISSEPKLLDPRLEKIIGDTVSQIYLEDPESPFLRLRAPEVKGAFEVMGGHAARGNVYEAMISLDALKPSGYPSQVAKAGQLFLGNVFSAFKSQICAIYLAHKEVASATSVALATILINSVFPPAAVYTVLATPIAKYILQQNLDSLCADCRG